MQSKRDVSIFYNVSRCLLRFACYSTKPRMFPRAALDLATPSQRTPKRLDEEWPEFSWCVGNSVLGRLRVGDRLPTASSMAARLPMKQNEWHTARIFYGKALVDLTNCSSRISIESNLKKNNSDQCINAVEAVKIARKKLMGRSPLAQSFKDTNKRRQTERLLQLFMATNDGE